MQFKTWLMAAAASAAFTPAFADEASSPPTDTQLSEVVVTAAPFAVSLDSVTTHVDIVTRDALDTGPLGGLGDVLSETPGVRSTFYGPGASRPVIRGLSGARVLLLNNGVGMTDASAISPDHAVPTDPAATSRIEVLRGPSALAYGGSGIGGVVNVIDETIPTRPAANGLEGRISGSLQSGDDAREGSTFVKMGSGPWVVSLVGSVRKSDNYHVPVAPVSQRYAAANGLTPIDTDVVENTPVSLSDYGIGTSYVADNGAYLGASFKRVQTTYGIPTIAATGGPPDDEGPVAIHLHQERVDVRGASPIDFGPFDQIKVSLGYADYQHAEVGVESGEIGTTFLSHGLEGRMELVQDDGKGHQGALGMQGLHRHFEAIGDEATVPPVDITEKAIFTLQRWDKGSWGIDAGLRVDQKTLQAPTVERTFTNWSASAGVFYRPADPWFLALSIGRTGRAPTEFELFSDGPHPGTFSFERGDPALSSESVANIEGTARWISGPLRIEGHLYYAKFSGYIDEFPTGQEEDGLPVFQFTQSNADFVGAEIESSFRLWSRDDKKVSLEGDYDWVRGSTPSGPPPRIPPWAVTGRLVWKSARTDATIEVRHVAAQNRVANFELPTDDYTMINASVDVRPFADQGVKIFLTGHNLNDIEAREHVSFLKDIAPLPGRQVRLGVSYNF